MDLGLNKLPWYGQVGAFVAISALALAGFYNFYVVEAQAEIAAKQATLDGLRGEIARGLAAAQRLPELRAEITDLEARLDNLKSVLPEQKDVAELLRRIQTLATQSNLTIVGFRPLPISAKEMHAEWPINLQLDGTYHNLALFFDRVSKVPRIINITNVHISADTDPEDPSTVNAECLATTFVLTEAAQAAGGPAEPPVPGAQSGAM